MCEDLADAYLKANRDRRMDNITDLDRWLDEVRILDDDMRKEASRGKRLFKLLMAESGMMSVQNAPEKCQHLPHANSTAMSASTIPTSSTASSSTSTMDGTAPSGRRPPRLMLAEKELLMKHLGCFTCREFYTDHIAPDCKTGSPDGATYRTLTEADALAAKAAYEAKKAKAIAGIKLYHASALEDDEEMIGDSSDLAEGVEYVSPALEQTIATPHLWMEGFVDSPALSSPLPV